MGYRVVDFIRRKKRNRVVDPLRLVRSENISRKGPLNRRSLHYGPNEQRVGPERKAVEGLRPSFSAHVRWCEHGAPVRSCGTRDRLEGEACGIPHLAKNERDVGHPATRGGDRAKAPPFPLSSRPERSV